MGRTDALVFVVDDDGPFRRSTERILRVAGYRVRALGSAEEFLTAEREDVASCLLLDVRMPGLGGLDLQRKLTTTRDMIPIVFMTGHGDIATSVSAMKAGAVEFLTKPFTDSELLAAVGEALARDVSRRREMAERDELAQRRDALTKREREVLSLVVAGKPNKQVAAELGISEITVKTHRRNVMTKMGAASLPELVRMTDRLQRLEAAELGDDGSASITRVDDV